MSSLEEKNALIKKLVREKHQLEDQLARAKRLMTTEKLKHEELQLTDQILALKKMLDEQTKRRLKAEIKLKNYMESDDREILNPVAVRAHVVRLTSQLRAHIELNDTLREQRDLWIHKFNHTREPKFDFNYLMRACEAIAK